LLLAAVLLLPCADRLGAGIVADPGESAPVGVTRVVIPELGISIELPQDWSIAEVNPTAARLVPNGEGGWPVEIVTWTSPAPERTAEQAVIAHERVLGQEWQYQRQSLEPFTNQSGWPGLMVSGTITTEQGASYIALFAGYALPDRYLVVGTFCSAEQRESLTSRIFAPLIASLAPSPMFLALTDRPPTAPAPPELPAPIWPPMSGAPAAPARPAEPTPPTLPPTPAPTPPAPPPEQWVQRTFPEGLAVKLPEGWTADICGGVFTAYAPDWSEQGVMVCPLLRLPQLTDEHTPSTRDTPAVLALWEQITQARFVAEREQWVQRGDATFKVVTGTIERNGAKLRTVVAISRYEEVILLTAAYAPEAELEQALAVLRRILASVSIARLTPTVPELVRGQTVQWVSPEGRLAVDLPEGWQARGQVTEYNGHTALRLEAQFAGVPRLRLAWHQPHTPFFREFTPLLRGLGRLPGQQYQERPEESPLVIMSKLPPAQLVTEQFLDSTAVYLINANIRRAEAYQPATRLVQGRTASGTLVEIAAHSPGGPISATYLLGVADLPVIEGSFRWQMGYLMWSYTAGLEWAARRALDMVVRTARVTDTATGAGDLATLVTIAQEVLPATGPLGTPRLAPLLSPAFAPQVAGPIKIPGSLLEYWDSTDG